MKISGRAYRTIWTERGSVVVIDQTRLPHVFATRKLDCAADAVAAIRTMVVRGAPLIGATAAYGLALGLKSDPSDEGLESACRELMTSRPTAVNLRHALEDVSALVRPLPTSQRYAAAWERAAAYCDEDVEINRGIGEAGFPLIEAIHRRTGRPVNVLTHCNAGWLATVDIGTATAPIYLAHDRGVPVHVFVDETRPRNQGAALTAFELKEHGVPLTLIADNAGGHLMQRGLVDLCIVGADRVTSRGDAANKIGTYLKALAAKANGVPFYFAVPSTTIDWRIEDGREIEIEERDSREVTHIAGRLAGGAVAEVEIGPPGVRAANPAFDVTPAELISGILTERGLTPADGPSLKTLFGR